LNITYQQTIYHPSLYKLSKESANVYNIALSRFWRVLRKKGIYLSDKNLARWVESDVKREFNHSQSFQASYQQFCTNWKNYVKAIKKWKQDPKKFTSKPKPPYKQKSHQIIRFKGGAIRIKGKELWLSLNKTEEPIKIKYNPKLPKPKQVLINYDHIDRVWKCSFVIKKEILTNQSLIKERTASADLGVNRSVAIGVFDNKNLIKTRLHSGKILKSITRIENKTKSKTQKKLSKLVKGSRKYKKILNASKKVSRRYKNRKKDILHKQSRQVVNDFIYFNVSKLFLGDCSSIHNKVDTGKKWNQLISQNPEQLLGKYITYKFESVGGVVETTPEHYTSKSCPKCNKKNTPKRRVYKCSSCKSIYDREEVAVINIWKRGNNFKVSQEENINSCVVGVLTTPHGFKWNPYIGTPTLKPDCHKISNNLATSFVA